MYASTLRKSSLSSMDERNTSRTPLSANPTKITVLLKNKNIYKSADHLLSVGVPTKHTNTGSSLFCETKGHYPIGIGVSSTSLSSMEKRLNGGDSTRSFDNLSAKISNKTSSLEHNEFMVN